MSILKRSTSNVPIYSQSKLPSKWWLLAIAVYVLIFLAMRLSNLSSMPVSIDETRHIFRAQSTLAGDLFIGLRAGLKQLYIWLVAMAIPYFGNPILAARLVSVLSGLMGAWVCYKLAQSCYPNRRVGYLAALFYLISPFALFYDRLALTDSLLTMLMGASILLSLQLWRHPSIKWAIALGLIFGLAALTKAYAALYYPTPILLWLVLGRNISWGRIAKLMVVVYAVTLIAWLPITAVGYEVYNEVYSYSAITSSVTKCEKEIEDFGGINPCQNLEEDTEETPQDQIGYLQGLTKSVWRNLSLGIEWLSAYLTLPAAVLLIFSTVMIIVKRDRFGYVLLILGVGFLLALAIVFSIWYPRYLLPLIVPISVVLALGVDYLAIYILRAGEKMTGRSLRTDMSQLLVQIIIFVGINLPYFSFDYMIIADPAQAPVPLKDRESFFDGEFSGYGLRESAQIIETMAQQYPKLTVFRGSNSISYAALNLYLQDLEEISLRNASASMSLQELNALAKEGPMLAIIISVVNANNEFFLPDGSNLFDRTKYPQLWRLASFPKPGWYWTVDLYQWLSPPDLAVRWFQEGGDADPRVAWQPSDTAVTAAGELLVDWPQTGSTNIETVQQSLAAAGVEYILANPQLIDIQAELFGPYITTDGVRLDLKKLPSGWRLAFAYPDLNCAVCLFQLRPPDHALQTTFADQILLEGYDISASELFPGESLYVTLYWHSLGVEPARQLVLLHLVDSAGNVVGQSEAPLFWGKLAGDGSETEVDFSDRHTLIIEPTLPAGDYTLLVGLSDPADSARMAVSSAQGQVLDNMVTLTTLALK